MARNFFILAMLLGIILGGTYFLNRAAHPPILVQEEQGAAKWRDEGPMAPDAPLTLLEGGRTSLRSFAGKPTLLHFWATWCPPCVKELPDIMKLAAANKDLVIVTVTVDQEQDVLPDFLRMMRQKAGLESLPDNFIVALDPEQSLTMEVFQTLALPETIFINTHGRMVDKSSGPVDDWLAPEMNKRLQSLHASSDAKQ